MNIWKLNGDLSADTGWIDLNEHIQYRKVQKIVFINIFSIFLQPNIDYVPQEKLPIDCRPANELPGMQQTFPLLGGSKRGVFAGMNVTSDGSIKFYFNGSTGQNFGGLFSFPVN